MKIDKAYSLAREQYAAHGVDTNKALKKLAAIRLSLHCWQGDDVGGFENSDGLTGGGIMATGAYPGKARTADELRLSNFLIWQTAYSEYYFTKVLWPDIRKRDITKALLSYSQRERRFGKI